MEPKGEIVVSKACEQKEIIENNVMIDVTYVYYIDESFSYKEKKWIFSAIGIPAPTWKTVFSQIKNMRRLMKHDLEIPLFKELHATKFVNGRGDYGPKAIKSIRAEIFIRILKYLARLSSFGVHIISSRNTDKYRCLERLLNRIERTMKANNSTAILFFDEGNEINTKKLVRRMCVINNIPSRFGGWGGDGESLKNIPLERIICDAQFVDSKKDLIIQMADIVAYALLCKDEPSKCVQRYNLVDAYDNLEPILLKQACAKNKLGIVE
jgi:hypothetical protein